MPNVFISWSGAQSKHVAKKLHEVLPMIISNAESFFSEIDIAKGAPSMEVLRQALVDVSAGVVCLTPGNKSNGWVQFESGAIACKVGDNTRLCTLLLGGLEVVDLAQTPFSLFQHTRPERTDIKRLFKSICDAAGTVKDRERLEHQFDKWYPDIEECLKTLPADAVPPTRQDSKMIEQILEMTMAEAQRKKENGFLDELQPLIKMIVPFKDVLAATLWAELSALSARHAMAGNIAVKTTASGNLTVSPISVPPESPSK